MAGSNKVSFFAGSLSKNVPKSIISNFLLRFIAILAGLKSPWIPFLCNSARALIASIDLSSTYLECCSNNSFFCFNNSAFF